MPQLQELQNPESPLIVLDERSLSAEFPVELKARNTLEAIGAGERTFTAILQRAKMSNKTLETTLTTLIGKGVIDKALPYSAQPRPKLSRYHVSDPYLRFWLRFVRASGFDVEGLDVRLTPEDIVAAFGATPPGRVRRRG